MQFTSLIATTSPNKIRDLVTADKKRITAYRDSDGYCYFEFPDGTRTDPVPDAEFNKALDDMIADIHRRRH